MNKKTPKKTHKCPSPQKHRGGRQKALPSPEPKKVAPRPQYKFSTELLRMRIRERYGTFKNFADALGISPVSLGQKLSYMRPITRNDIVACSELLEIPKDKWDAYFFTVIDEKE